MNFELVEEYDNISHYLGFSERKVFEIKSVKSFDQQKILEEILKSKIFFKIFNGWTIEDSKRKYFSQRTNHAFTDKIEIVDFEKLSYKELVDRIENIFKEPDWGDDLLIFKKLFEEANDWLLKNEGLNAGYYFIYSENISPEKLIEINYYAYHISIIVFLNKARFAILNFAED